MNSTVSGSKTPRPVGVASSCGGFSLPEVLVVVAVMGVLAVVLIQLTESVVLSMRRNEARTRMQETLHVAAQQIMDDLKSIARNHSQMKRGTFFLVGVDGDGTYEDELLTSHQDLSNPQDRSDRLHVVSQHRINGLDGKLGTSDDDLASDRFYVSFWLNGPGSTHSIGDLTHVWGIARRVRNHTRDDRRAGFLIPYYSGESQPAPLLDLNGGDPNHQGVQALAQGVDYLSFRFYDAESQSWVEDEGSGRDGTATDGSAVVWDSRVRGRFPSAVEFSIRAYHHRVGGAVAEPTVTPMWYRNTVALVPVN